MSTTGVEPARAIAHYPLKVARLPIPPRGHKHKMGLGNYALSLKLIQANLYRPKPGDHQLSYTVPGVLLSGTPVIRSCLAMTHHKVP